MPDFSTVEDTLFVPMLGRIYASEQFPNILCDKKALELKEKLPKNLKGQDTQTQYTLLASAVRSTNMDRYIQNFLSREKDGLIVQIGCGLETTFFRNDNGKNQWYGVDLPDVIAYRRKLMGDDPRETLIAGDAFSTGWIESIRQEHPDAPLLITASGLFYYFEMEKVQELLEKLTGYGHVEMVFDAVNGAGMQQMGKYMKQVGHEDAAMFFFVDSAQELAQKVGGTLLAEEPYYAHTPKKHMKLMTSLSMRISDKSQMVKMVHLKLG